jgi:hypothetical protein
MGSSNAAPETEGLWRNEASTEAGRWPPTGARGGAGSDQSMAGLLGSGASLPLLAELWVLLVLSPDQHSDAGWTRQPVRF